MVKVGANEKKGAQSGRKNKKQARCQRAGKQVDGGSAHRNTLAAVFIVVDIPLKSTRRKSTVVLNKISMQQLKKNFINDS